MATVVSAPALRTALEVLAAAGVQTHVSREGDFTLTLALSGDHPDLHTATDREGVGDGIIIALAQSATRRRLQVQPAPRRPGGQRHHRRDSGARQRPAARGWRGSPLAVRGRPPGADRPRARFSDARTWTIRRGRSTSKPSRARAGQDRRRSGGRRQRVQYWPRIGERFGPRFDGGQQARSIRASPSMPLDADGKIRMDCSSPYAHGWNYWRSRARTRWPSATTPTPIGTASRTPAGLMNSNHHLAVAIEYLFTHRPGCAGARPSARDAWSRARSSIACVGSLGRELRGVCRWDSSGSWRGYWTAASASGGEESGHGASFLRRDGHVHTTDKRRHPP